MIDGYSADKILETSLKSFRDMLDMLKSYCIPRVYFVLLFESTSLFKYILVSTNDDVAEKTVCRRRLKMAFLNTQRFATLFIIKLIWKWRSSGNYFKSTKNVSHFELQNMYIQNIKYNSLQHSFMLPFRWFSVLAFINLMFLWISAEIAFLLTFILSKNATLAQHSPSQFFQYSFGNFLCAYLTFFYWLPILCVFRLLT